VPTLLLAGGKCRAVFGKDCEQSGVLAGILSMAQIFHRSSNSLAKISIVAVLLVLGSVVLAAYKINAGSFITDVYVARDQPVPFSHKHHTSDDGIDCRYCHTSV